jgi:hypothetical protein
MCVGVGVPLIRLHPTLVAQPGLLAEQLALGPLCGLTDQQFSFGVHIPNRQCCALALPARTLFHLLGGWVAITRSGVPWIVGVNHLGLRPFDPFAHRNVVAQRLSTR